MTDTDWVIVKQLLDEALELAPEKRAVFLDRVCTSNPGLRAELESLLMAAEDLSADFLLSPMSGDMKASVEALEFAGGMSAGELLAQRFRLIEKLGEGGMGQVWLAEQNSPVKRRVALKLIRAGMYDAAAVLRFQTEQQSLAIMDHPTISKVFEAGTTAQGQPYFVMEFVAGIPITEYCDQNRLAIRDRLELFILACEGVQHAHQRAIIHRDLKPSNILVAEIDGKPVPRIIDFGLAKATNPALGGELTRFGQFLGTPGYMSPEQVDPKVQDIDTRTDVYSLGVILYVLLTGSQPFATEGEQRPLEEWLRRLREEEPPRPSGKVSQQRDTSTKTADARGTEPKQLASLLRGDLDWIAMKALERDRERRYVTPSALAADLRRYLDHEPVEARPASAGYRIRKYARRHRVAVGVGAGLLALLAVFSAAQTLQLRQTTRERDRANQERDRANQERDRASRITDFMTGMFKVSDPNEAHGNSVTAREILDKASNDIGTGLAQDSEVQSQMLGVMAATYNNLGLNTRAHELAQRALADQMRLFGPEDARTLESMTQLGLILHQQGNDPESEKLERQALEVDRRVLGTEDPLTLKTMDNLAITLMRMGHYAEAEQLARQVVEIASHTLGPENGLTLRATDHLGSAMFFGGRAADAEKVLRPALAMDRRVLGSDHPDTLIALTMLAICVHHQHRDSEAEVLYREAETTTERVLGPEHRSTGNALGNLANVLQDEGRLKESEQIYRRAFAVDSHALGPDHPATLIDELNFARLLLQEGHLHEAERMQRQTLATEVRVHGAEYPDTLMAQSDLAQTLEREHRYADAEQLARETFDVQLRTLGPRHPEMIDTLQRLGIAMAHNHHYAKATELFADVIEQGEKLPQQGVAGFAWYAFATVAATSNHPEDALRYLREAVNHGFTEVDSMLADDDMKALLPNPKFQQFVAELKRRP